MSTPADDFRFAPVSQLDPASLAQFASEVWPGESDRRDILSSWWMTSGTDVATAAIDKASGRVAGVCVGMPSEWEVDGHRVSAVSICNWYVSPAFMGRGLGKRLVRSFAERAPFMNTFSISAAAVENFRKLGWIGPFRSELLLFPLPLIRSALRRRRSGVTIETFRLGPGIPSAAAALLDQIDRERPATPLRQRRRASDWQRHLSYFPERLFNLNIVRRDGRPIAYFALRRADRFAGRLYRRTRLAYVSDLVINDPAPEMARAVLDAIAASPAVRDAGAILLCTTDAAIAAAAENAGWWSGRTPLIGRPLTDKAPLYMKGDGFKEGGPEGMALQLTFFDSDVDLNI